MSVLARRRSGVVTTIGLSCALGLWACAKPAPPVTPPPAPVASAPSASAALPEREPPPGPDIAPERPKRAFSRRVLANGLVVVRLDDGPRTTTVLSVGLAGLGTGSEDEHTGLSRVAVGAWLATAGFDDAITKLGGQLAVAVEADRTRLTVAVPTTALAPALTALAKLWARPAASAASFRAARAREASLFTVRTAGDDAFVARHIFLRRVFQLPVSLHPYASSAATPSELDRLALPEVQAFLRRRVSADATTVVVTGAPEAALTAAIDPTLGKLRGGPPDLPALTPPFPPDDTRIVLVDRPGAALTTVHIGFAGLPRSSPAYSSVALAAPLVEQALRRDPSVPPTAHARLWSEIPRGSVPFVVELQTAERDPSATIATVRAIVKLVATTAPSASDLGDARRQLLRARPLGVRDAIGTDELLDELAWARELDVDDFQKAIQSADPVGLPADLAPVLDCPEVIVVLGDASRIAKRLATIADVDVFALAAPPSKELTRARSLIHAPAAPPGTGESP